MDRDTREGGYNDPLYWESLKMEFSVESLNGTYCHKIITMENYNSIQYPLD